VNIQDFLNLKCGFDSHRGTLEIAAAAARHRNVKLRQVIGDHLGATLQPDVHGCPANRICAGCFPGENATNRRKKNCSRLDFLATPFLGDAKKVFVEGNVC
jgi:hypothetical protein